MRSVRKISRSKSTIFFLSDDIIDRSKQPGRPVGLSAYAFRVGPVMQRVVRQARSMILMILLILRVLAINSSLER